MQSALATLDAGWCTSRDLGSFKGVYVVVELDQCACGCPSRLHHFHISLVARHAPLPAQMHGLMHRGESEGVPAMSRIVDVH